MHPSGPAVAVDALAQDLHRSGRSKLLGFVLLSAALIVSVVASLALGARDIAPSAVVEALLGLRPHDDYETIVVLAERLPRTVLGLAVGASLGAAGVIMQSVTRNPLADPGILGIELGAALFVVLGIVGFGASGATSYFWFALAGAAATTVVVLWIGRSARSASPQISLVIGGAAVAALMAAAINLLIVRDPTLFAHYRYWSIGQLNGRGAVLEELWPFTVAALILALSLGRRLDALHLGDEVAAALGRRVGRDRVIALAVGVLLCGTATAAVGPVAFVGLVGAHLARLVVGLDHRWMLPYSMLCGAVVLVAADVLGRLGPGGGEVEVGVMTAVVGAPFFVMLARRRRAVAA